MTGHYGQDRLFRSVRSCPACLSEHTEQEFKALAHTPAPPGEAVPPDATHRGWCTRVKRATYLTRNDVIIT